MSRKRDIRQAVFGDPIPDFSGGFPDETDVFRVYLWHENLAGEGSSPTLVCEEVSRLLRGHWRSLGKPVQDKYAVRKKVETVVKKAKKLDNCSHILDDPDKFTPLKRANFKRVVDIEDKKCTAPNVVRVSKLNKPENCFSELNRERIATIAQMLTLPIFDSCAIAIM